jgi:predicted Holliday junction resolvase-like endonuclease
VTWFLIVVLALVVVLALMAVLVLAAYVTDESEAERARIEMEVRRAERRLHDVASSGFQQMLDAARGHEPR